MAKIGIVGIRGQLGASLDEWLSSAGHVVVPIDRIANLPSSARESIGLEVPAEALASALELHRVEAVLNTAVTYGIGAAASTVFQTNVSLPLKIAEACQLGGVETFIQIGSVIKRSKNIYGMSKDVAREALSRMATGNAALVNLSPDLFYGVRTLDESRLIGYLLVSLLLKRKEVLIRQPNQVRNFLYANDLCRAVAFVIERRLQAGFYDFYLKGSVDVRIADFAAAAVRYLAVETNIVSSYSDDAEEWRPDIEARTALEDFGWFPTYDIPRGLVDLGKRWQANNSGFPKAFIHSG